MHISHKCEIPVYYTLGSRTFLFYKLKRHKNIIYCVYCKLYNMITDHIVSILTSIWNSHLNVINLMFTFIYVV